MLDIFDITGKRYGRLIVLEKAEKDKWNKTRWLCQCDCGNTIVISRSSLTTGNTLSCGCLRKETTTKTAKSNKKHNEYFEIDKNTIGAKTYNTNEIFFFDAEDFELVKSYCWNRDKGRGKYLVSKIPDTNSRVLLHKLVLGFPDSLIDHKDRNTLNNKKENLRPATYSQNNSNVKNRIDNKTGIKGVSWNSTNKNWRSMLDCNNIRVLDKSFYDFQDAIKARLLAEKEYFGEFAPQTHLFKQYGIK